jgi:hypothetical protein
MIGSEWLTLPDIVGEARSATSRRDIVENDFGHCCWTKMISKEERMVVIGCRLRLVMRWVAWKGYIDLFCVCGDKDCAALRLRFAIYMPLLDDHIG